MACAAGDHEFEPAGMFEGYPYSKCRDCNAGALYDSPDRAPVLEFFLRRLEVLGLQPRPANAGDAA